MMEKYVPMRMCVGCRKMRPKAELVRLTAGKDGGVLIDETGKRQSRGVYICKSEECVLLAKKKKAFERAFKCAVPAELYERVCQ